ncbi:MAG TPA: hypothetical protein VF486_09870 [Actinomycetes bacterium]
MARMVEFFGRLLERLRRLTRRSPTTTERQAAEGEAWKYRQGPAGGGARAPRLPLMQTPA